MFSVDNEMGPSIAAASALSAASSMLVVQQQDAYFLLSPHWCLLIHTWLLMSKLDLVWKNWT